MRTDGGEDDAQAGVRQHPSGETEARGKTASATCSSFQGHFLQPLIQDLTESEWMPPLVRFTFRIR